MSAHLVVAHYDFVPEFSDEIELRVGDVIELVEKDEPFSDGWWRGRAPNGKIGLFPGIYTSSDPSIAIGCYLPQRCDQRRGRHADGLWAQEDAEFVLVDSPDVYTIGGGNGAEFVNRPAPTLDSPISASSFSTSYAEGVSRRSTMSPSPSPVSFSRTPTEQWTVLQVLAWLEAKGFDAEIRQAFCEQEITGDVLLDLTVAELKNEIGIVALGKRKRILKAIGELQQFRRPDKLGAEGLNGSVERAELPSDSVVEAQSRKVNSRPASLVLVAQGFADAGEREKGAKAGSFDPNQGRSNPTGRLDPPQSPHTLTISDEQLWSANSSDASPTSTSSLPPSPLFTWEQGGNKPAHGGQNNLNGGYFEKGDMNEEHPENRHVVEMPKESANDQSDIGAALAIRRKPVPLYPIREEPRSNEELDRALSRLNIGYGFQHDAQPSQSRGVVSTSNWPHITFQDPDPNLISRRPSLKVNSNPTEAGEPDSSSHTHSLDQIKEPEYWGWMRKRGRYGSWKLRYFVLKGLHLYILRSPVKSHAEACINITGYKIIADERAHPGQYGFRMVHNTLKPHYFSSEEQIVIREWMKALKKATIVRHPVHSSYHPRTVSLAVAQQMQPGRRSASEHEVAYEYPTPPTSRAMVTWQSHNADVDAFPNKTEIQSNALPAGEQELVDWVNSKLPPTCPPAQDLSTSMSSGLIPFRLAESIKGINSGVPDSAFMHEHNNRKLDGLFELFRLLRSRDMPPAVNAIDVTDIRNGNSTKIIQLVCALRNWDEKRIAARI
ncbi:SH3 domain-binding protein [Ceratobasidium theobromae]|uniref:SH3 domain-binding protein n=1 Tax=Ceratobasidium theobromae TaxID=1582974 RepID=A0A5N5QBT0_9AGAM|nr:SH3 domain-binding protein [Ceratobasidium theobromae]